MPLFIKYVSNVCGKGRVKTFEDGACLSRCDVWQIGRSKFTVRSSQLPCLKPSQDLVVEGEQNDSADGRDQKIIVQAKLEYHSQKAAQGELITDAELAKWWLASQLHLGASVWVSFYASFFSA